MKLKLAPSASSPPDLKSLLGPPPLLEGEESGAYDALYGQIRTAVAPRDVLEEIWARDVIDNLWETLRLRRLKVSFMRASAHEGVARFWARGQLFWSVASWAVGRRVSGQQSIRSTGF